MGGEQGAGACVGGAVERGTQGQGGANGRDEAAITSDLQHSSHRAGGPRVVTCMQAPPGIPSLVGRVKNEPIGAALLSLVSDSGVYLAGGVLVGIGNIILIPLYTRYLALREFGVYALIDVLVLLVVTVSCLKMDVSYLKSFADLDASRHGELLGSTLLIGLLTSAVSGLAIALFTASRLGGLTLHTPVRTYAWLLLPIVVLETPQALLLTDLRARRKSTWYSVAALVRVVGMTAASYYWMSIEQKGLWGLFLGRLAGDAVSVAFLAAICLRPVVWRFSRSLLGPMLRFGAPLIGSVFAVMVQDMSGRYFLTRYGTLEQVGLLGAAIKIGAVFQMAVSVPFGVAWGGILFQIVKKPDAQVIYSKIFGYVYVLALAVALLVAIWGSTLFHIFTAPAYYSATIVLPLVLLVRAVSVIEQPAAVGVYLAGRTDLLALGYIAALGVNLVLLRLLVPHFGLLGVGYAWLLGSAITPVLFLIIGQRWYRLSLRPKLLVAPVLLWICVYMLRSEADLYWPGHALLLQAALSVFVLCVAGMLLSFDFYELHRELRARPASTTILEVSSQ